MNETNPWNDIYTVFINLPQETDRRSFMEQQLTKLAIPYTVLDATNGRTYEFGNEYNESLAVTKNGRPLTAPEKGCALSHKRALKEFLASGKNYGLIMEDDIVLDSTFPDTITSSIKKQEKHAWTYLQFNYSPVGWEGVQLWWFLFLHNKDTLSITNKLISVSKGLVANSLSILWGMRNAWYIYNKKDAVCTIVRDQYLAGCYLLTREAAQALIELNTPLAYTADRIQNIARGKKIIKHLVYVPRIARQKREAFASSINNDHFGEEVISY